MPNLENLIPNSERTPEQLREQTIKAGKASGEARRKKRDLRLALEALLEKDFKDEDGMLLSGAEMLALKQFQKGMEGDTKAFEVIRDTAGQKPVEKVEVGKIDKEQSLQELKDLFADDE